MGRCEQFAQGAVCGWELIDADVEGAEEARAGLAGRRGERDGVVEVVGVGLDHEQVAGEVEVLLGGAADHGLLAGKDGPDAVLGAVEAVGAMQVFITGVVVLGVELARVAGRER